ncbi:MAG: helix-turn-helix domain-containing protein [Eubacterium sp.]|nr:helix-turn-helix domain-containing protein [Eubacterium sp.]
MGIDYKLIGKRIQTSRKKRNITQQELAEFMDVSVGYISQIERGITKPKLTTIDSICSYIGCDLIYIIAGVNENV